MWGQQTALPLLLLVAGILVITEAFSAFNEQNKWALDGLILEGASENTIVVNWRCWTDEERTRKAKPWHTFHNDVPVRNQAPQNLFSRAAPNGFRYLSLLQKMPPSHQPTRGLPQPPGSKLKIGWFLFLLLSDLAVWDLLPYNSLSRALQRPASLFPICRQQRFTKCPTELSYGLGFWRGGVCVFWWGLFGFFSKVWSYHFSSSHFLHLKEILFAVLTFLVWGGNDEQMVFCRHDLTKPASIDPHGCAASTEAVCDTVCYHPQKQLSKSDVCLFLLLSSLNHSVPFDICEIFWQKLLPAAESAKMWLLSFLMGCHRHMLSLLISELVLFLTRIWAGKRM